MKPCNATEIVFVTKTPAKLANYLSHMRAVKRAFLFVPSFDFAQQSSFCPANNTLGIERTPINECRTVSRGQKMPHFFFLVVFLFVALTPLKPCSTAQSGTFTKKRKPADCMAKCHARYVLFRSLLSCFPLNSISAPHQAAFYRFLPSIQVFGFGKIVFGVRV